MSFATPKRLIEEGDIVLLYFGVINQYPIEVTRQITTSKGLKVENTFQSKYGAIKIYEALIGKEYGSKVVFPKGFGYVLQMNPELWTMNLPHRTQILYTPDISMILMELEVRPGSIVIEAGTGSGSLSHAFIRAVKDHGRLYTFDFHEARVKAAIEEFTKHGFNDYVTAQHRDVCEEGFTEELNGKADAIFLDLPNPCVAIKHVVKALKPGE
jgi:tRNA (adenine57-N1/adenine58-N1)-methyltransferase catalytic subunit